jgi:phosphomannomutase
MVFGNFQTVNFEKVRKGLPGKTTIEFGTDGWRAVIEKDFTFENVGKVAQAIADFLNWEERQKMSVYRELNISYRPASAGLVVGYDTRRLSSEFGETVARVLAANGIPVFLVDQPNPTPVVAHAVLQKEAAGAVMITASHNPPEYNGIKFKPEYAGSALPEYTEQIEKRVWDILAKGKEVKKNPIATIETFDPRVRYLERIVEFVDWEALRKSNFKVVVDPLYGAGRGILYGLLKQRGISAQEIHGELDPTFGGLNPEPIGEHIRPLTKEVLKQGADAGLALDGDADRIGAVDENGNFVNSHQIFSLILRYLCKDLGWKGAVVKTFSTTQMINILASKYELKLFETPVGFKHIARLMLSEDVLIGGEESGGIGIKNHIPERDGILCGLLLLQIMAKKESKLGEVIADLMREVGPHFFDRRDFHFEEPGQKEKVLERLRQNPPREIAGKEVAETNTLDGWKFFFGDGSWVLFRPSGTEPMLRLYVEAGSKERVEEIINAGEKIIKESWR